jgi:hypothetical protein
VNAHRQRRSNVAADALAPFQLDLDAFGILRETDRTGAKSNGVWLHFPHMALHERVQVCAVQQVVGETVL